MTNGNTIVQAFTSQIKNYQWLVNPTKEQSTLVVTPPYWYGSNPYTFLMGTPMMLIGTHYVATQPNMSFLMH
jgi:hypothetical protein